MSISLSYKSQGTTGAVIIILHGLFGSGGNWRSVARSLSESHLVYTLDLRNHGDSPHTDTMSYPTMAADVRAFMDAENIDAATVIGHSMGGKTAMRLALESPERVARLVVVDIAPVVSPTDHLPALRAMTALNLEGVTTRSEADRRLATELPDAGLRMFLLQNLRSHPAGFQWRLNLRAIESSLESLLDFPDPDTNWQYPGPTAIVRGELSDYVLPEHHDVIRALFPLSEIITIEGAGHWLHAEQPDRFLGVLAGLLPEQTP